MRLSQQSADTIRNTAKQIFGADAEVYLFGSRLDDRGRGGDVDLLVITPDPVNSPAYTAAKLAARVSRLLAGRGVDVIVDAPNLAKMPLHRIARETGKPL